MSNEKLNLANATPAQIVQHLIELKWNFLPTDKDMIVMKLEHIYELVGGLHGMHASLVVKDEYGIRTAMAQTVGLPLGITAKLLLANQIKLKGVNITVYQELYNPVLKELKDLKN